MSDAPAASATIPDPKAATPAPSTPAPAAAAVDAVKAATPVVKDAPAAVETAKVDAPKRLLGDEPAKSTDAPKDAPKTEEWKLEAPKDSLISAAEVTALEAEAKKLGLDKDKATALLSFRDVQAKAEFEATDKRWYAEAMANPDIGGDKMTETVALAKRFMGAHLPKEMAQAVINSPFANHPIFLYAMSKAGALMPTEDTVHASGAQPAGKAFPTTADERHRAMYPHLYK